MPEEPEMFLKWLDHARNELKRRGVQAFRPEQLERFNKRYDELITAGNEGCLNCYPNVNANGVFVA